MELLEHLKEKIQADIEDVKEDMAKGTAPDYAAYRQQVGMVQALRRNLYVLDEISKSMREDGDID